MENSLNPDQLASGSMLFSNDDISGFSREMVKISEKHTDPLNWKRGSSLVSTLASGARGLGICRDDTK